MSFVSENYGISPCKIGKRVLIPLYTAKVPAGMLSPADDYLEKPLDLNDLVIKHPAATFYVRVEGHSMKDAGIFSGDILVIDRSLKATNGKIVLAILNGEFTVKRFFLDDHGVMLCPANPSYRPIKVTEEMDFQVWGVVTYVIHRAQ